MITNITKVIRFVNPFIHYVYCLLKTLCINFLFYITRIII